MPSQLAPSSSAALDHATVTPHANSWAAVCVFALPVMALTTSFGMALIQVAMLLACVWLVCSGGQAGLMAWYRQHFSSIRGIVLAFAGFFVLSAIRGFATDGGLASLDGPLRMLLALSCIGFVGYLKPHIRYFWLGLCIGVIGAFLLALLQKFWLGMERVDGYTHHPISFGDLSLALGCMAVCAMASWRANKLADLPLVALLCGLSISVLS
ncbi:MAG: hypothetical protein HYZ45_13920, partial [Burkholderiales bacterium]|nr:hypothetical protein [Burkholderiales bacterium]